MDQSTNVIEVLFRIQVVSNRIDSIDWWCLTTDDDSEGRLNCVSTPPRDSQHSMCEKTTNTHVHIDSHGESVGRSPRAQKWSLRPFPSVSGSPDAAGSWGSSRSSTGSRAVECESACCFRKNVSRKTSSSRDEDPLWRMPFSKSTLHWSVHHDVGRSSHGTRIGVRRHEPLQPVDVLEVLLPPPHKRPDPPKRVPDDGRVVVLDDLAPSPFRIFRTRPPPG